MTDLNPSFKNNLRQQAAEYQAKVSDAAQQISSQYNSHVNTMVT